MKKSITAKIYKITEYPDVNELCELKINNSNILFLRSVLLSNNKFYEDKNGNIVWIKDILTDIQPYYYKFSNKFRLK